MAPAPKAYPRRALLGALVLGIGLSGIAAVLYVTSAGTGWLGDRAVLLARVDVSATQTQVAQHQLAHALLLGTDLEAGITTPETLRLATASARQTLNAIDLTQLAEAELPELGHLVAAYAGAGERLLDRLERRDLTGARALAGGEVVGAYNDLSTALADIRSELLASIEQARSNSGVFATVAGVVIALLIPVAMVALYRSLARRHLRRVELEATLAAEQELSRSKDEFIANISHELRTPLTSIYGFAQVLEQDATLDREISNEIIQVIISQAGELARMVDDLLAAARAKAGMLSYQMRLVEIDYELAQVVSGLDRSEGGVRTRLEPVLVAADPLRLRQILRNLLANARKHGGDQIEVIGRQVGSQYELAVVDNGPGVPEQLLGAMFQRFMHTGDTALVAGSVGLGLHIARTLAQGMGGDLEYQRRDGLTQFILTLEGAQARPSMEREHQLADA
ncbi:MAG TPA: HAMP domain-containing sensor histidine kinase [Acidimicrobiia bacterium]|nr:HAMP domain-containing sensor histidine kinase [Acidimicrobiia bacterium]